ncbi:MAG: RNA polymerase sigma subunit [Parcubacteria group bacterium Gr01-1014_13]|nr:MAG: RNA polymerase sigma subunit [Parcubacteria group bacterium Gr01-1014_13]
MSEKIPFQPTAEATNNKEVWLKELNSKKTRDTILRYLNSLKIGFSYEDAEDIVQQTMLNAAKGIEAGRFRGDSKLTTWLYVIIKNQALNFLRRAKKTIPSDKMIGISEVPTLKDTQPNSEERYITAEEAKNLRSSFDVLAPKQKEVMELLAEGLTNKEIAQQLGIHVGTVKSYAFRAARKILRKHMENEGGK